MTKEALGRLIVTEEMKQDMTFASVISREEVIGYLREIFSEERADVLIELVVGKIKGKLPGWAKLFMPLFVKVIDRLLPEAFIDAVDEALIKLGL